jgi:hypothetical protein
LGLLVLFGFFVRFFAAFLTEIFDNPFVTRKFLLFRSLHQLGLVKHLRLARRAPFDPDKAMRLGADALLVAIWLARVTNAFAVLADRATAAGDAEFFALAAPTDDLDFFLFTNQAANLASLIATAMAAGTVTGLPWAGGDRNGGCDQQQANDGKGTHG